MKLLLKLFIKDYQNVQDKKVREQYGVLSGAVGILCNILLFAVKFTVGLLTNSVAVFADAFNNLSDCGSSAVSIIGAKMSNMKPDKEHPFGHGRVEYISSLIVSFLIIIVGFELLKTSADKIIHPVDVSLNITQFCILVCTILVKLWMYLYNKKMGKAISSTVLLATAKDSLNDSVATSATILAVIFSFFVDFPVDGIFGVLVSLFIMYGGYGLAKDTIGILLGNPASEEMVKQITDIVTSGEGIIGVHDLIVHDYGPGRVMASVHAEVSDRADIVAVHEVIDDLENLAQKEMDIHLVIHMDPISTDNPAVNELRAFLHDYLPQLDSRLSFHDLRITPGENNRNVLFDLVIPCEYAVDQQKKLAKSVENAILTFDARYAVHIKIDFS